MQKYEEFLTCASFSLEIGFAMLFYMVAVPRRGENGRFRNRARTFYILPYATQRMSNALHPSLMDNA